MEPINIPKASTAKRRVLDYILRKNRPVLMREIKEELKKRGIDACTLENVGPTTYSMCTGYTVCKMKFPLLRIEKVESNGRMCNAFLPETYMTPVFVSECDIRLKEDAFEHSRVKAKAIKIIKPNGDIVVRTKSGTLKVGKKEDDGTETRIVPYRCCWCQTEYPDISEASFVVGVGWFCDDCHEEYKNEQ